MKYAEAYAGEDEWTNLVHFTEKNDYHLLEWVRPQNHHYNNTLEIVSTESHALDIYHESSECPFNATKLHNPNYSKSDFYRTIYNDEEMSQCNYDSDDDDDYNERRILSFLWLRAGVVGLVAKLFTIFRKSSDEQILVDDEVLIGGKITRDAMTTTELAVEVASAYYGQGTSSVAAASAGATSSSASASVVASAATSAASTGSASSATISLSLVGVGATAGQAAAISTQ
jgi:hypothetical protein